MDAVDGGARPFRLEHTGVLPGEDYVWGRWHRAYLDHCAAACPLGLHERRTACGYRNTAKFVRREAEWLGCVRPIPAAWLEVIGCGLDMLRAAVDLDGEEYDQALEAAGVPEYFVIRLFGGMCSRRSLGGARTLAEAEDAIRRFQEGHPRLGCALHWPGLRMIRYERGEAMEEDRFRPRMAFTPEGVVFNAPPEGVGLTGFR